MINQTSNQEVLEHNNNTTSGLFPPEEKLHDFNKSIDTIIKFIDLYLDDTKLPDHLKTDLRVLRATLTVLSANYPFTTDPNITDTTERKFRREHALSNITAQMATIALDESRGKFDQKRK